MPSRNLWVITLLLTAICSNSVPAKELEDRKWLEVRTDNFRIQSLLSKTESIELARQFEAFRVVVRLITGIDLVESPVQTRIFAITGGSAAKDFGIDSSTAGTFRTDLRTSWIVINNLYGDTETDITLHNYVHFLLNNFSPLQLPLWFKEGMAEYISCLRIRSDDVVVGGIPDSAVPIFHHFGSWTHVERIVSRQFDDISTEKGNRIFFGESWALVHFLISSPEQAPQLSQRIALYSRALEGGGSPVDAFDEIFGISVNRLNQELWEYVVNEQPPGISIPIESALPDFNPVVRRMSREEVALSLGEFALAQENTEMADRWFQVAAAEGESNSRLAAGFGQIKLAQGENEKARAYFERALASAQGDPYQYLNIGGYWYQMALEAEETAVRQQAIDRAKHNFLKAQKLNAGLVDFYAMYGQLLLLEGDANDQAVRMLEEAHRLLPSNRNIMLALADAYRFMGEHDTATNVALRAERSLQAFEAAQQSHRILVNTRVAD